MRILHTMLRVGDLDRSLHFYMDILGMRLLRRADYPAGKFTLAFVGFEDEENGAVIELTYNWALITTNSAPATATLPLPCQTPPPPVKPFVSVAATSPEKPDP